MSPGVYSAASSVCRRAPVTSQYVCAVTRREGESFGVCGDDVRGRGCSISMKTALPAGVRWTVFMQYTRAIEYRLSNYSQDLCMYRILLTGIPFHRCKQVGLEGGGFAKMMERTVR